MLKALLAGLLAVLLLVLAPAAAPAARDRHVPLLPVLRVDGTHGYKIDIWANPEGEHGIPEVSLSIWKGRAETIYVVPGQVNSDGFSASFHHFGWIDVHYRPAPPPTVKDCRGHSRRSAEGRYTGTFEFHGERRFTEADYPWLDVRSLPENTGGCLGASSGGAKGATLEALSGYGVTKVIQNQAGGRVRFMARAENEYGSLRISRFIEAFGPARDFIWSRRFRSARVTAPAPFHGTASYRVSRTHDNWRGNLTVDFPGFRDYPLTYRPTVAFFGPGVCKVHGPPRHRPPGLCL